MQFQLLAYCKTTTANLDHYYTPYSLPVVTPEWLTLMHSCIIATNMAYYNLLLWNPVLRKVVLSIPWRHNGGAKVQLHSFLILATIWRWVINYIPWPLHPMEESTYSLSKRLGDPTACLGIAEKRKITGVQTPYFAACSIVTIAHSVTQASNQHTLQSPVHSLLLCQQS
jgi:hypothetical protein